MPELVHQILEIERDDGFVFDDEHARGELFFDRPLGLDDEPLDRLGLLAQDLPGLGKGKALDRGEKSAARSAAESA